MSKITIENLVLYKRIKKEKMPACDMLLLKGISCLFESGKLNAIMGPSGSSKSTLMKFLVGFCESTTKTSGRILYDGNPRQIKEWKKLVTFVQKDIDSFYDTSVKTYLASIVDLKNANTRSNEKLSCYKELIQRMHLEKIFSSKISTLSEGEKHRVAIVSEMILEKKVMIVDEPITDQDQHIAYDIVQYLKEFAAKKDIIMIISINQATDVVMQKFDNILLMKDGYSIYSGKYTELEPFLAQLGLKRPANWSFSEFLVELLYNNTPRQEIAAMQTEIAQFLKSSKLESDETVDSTKVKNKSTISLDFNINPDVVKCLFRRMITERNFVLIYLMKITCLFVLLSYRAYQLYKHKAIGIAGLNNVDYKTNDVSKYVYKVFEHDLSLYELPILKKISPYAYGCSNYAIMSFDLDILMNYLGADFVLLSRPVMRQMRKNHYTPINFLCAAVLLNMAAYFSCSVLMFILLSVIGVGYKMSLLCIFRTIVTIFLYFLNSCLYDVILFTLPKPFETAKDGLKYMLPIFNHTLFTWVILFMNSFYKKIYLWFIPVHYLHYTFAYLVSFTQPSIFFFLMVSNLIQKRVEKEIKKAISISDPKNNVINPYNLNELLKKIDLSRKIIETELWAIIEKFPAYLIFISSVCFLLSFISLFFVYINTPRMCLSP